MKLTFAQSNFFESKWGRDIKVLCADCVAGWRGLLLPSLLDAGDRLPPRAPAVPHASALPQLQGPLSHPCLHMRGALTPSVTQPANATVITSHDISRSNAARHHHMMQTVIAPLERHQARFLSKYLVGHAENFISSSCFAFCCCLAFRVPWHPTFPQAGPCRRRERAAYRAPWVCPRFSRCCPAGVTRSSVCVAQGRTQVLPRPSSRKGCGDGGRRLLAFPEALPPPGRHTRGWPLTGSGEGDRELPGKPPRWRERAHPCRMVRASQKPKLGLLVSMSASSGFPQRGAASPPGSRGWSLLSPRSCRALRDTASLSKLAGGSLEKAARTGRGELGQSQGRAPGWLPQPGAGREVVAEAAPSWEGRLPISPSQQQLPPPSPGCSCCKELPPARLCPSERLRPAPQPLRLRGARLQPARWQTSNPTHSFSTATEENKRQLLERVWVPLASIRETHHCSGNPARPMIFPSRLQAGRIGFYAKSEEPLCPAVPLPGTKPLKSKTTSKLQCEHLPAQKQ